MDIMKLLREAQRMQTEAQAVQEEIERTQHEGAAGGGVVRAVVDGLGRLVSVRIAPETVDPADVAMLEDLVVAAVQQAQDVAARAREQRIQGLTSGLAGLGLPGLGG